MAKKAKKVKTKKGLALKIVNPDAAGIDISSTEMQVCVPLDRAEQYNRKFGVFTENLEEISVWLKSCGITTVAMESTGVYWVPLYMNLQSHDIEVYLVNAKSISNFLEEKTDEVDAESLMLLHSYGLLKASFQVNNFAREIRNLSRHRENLIRTSSKEVLHMQKSMELMNLKLSNVLSDITGKSGMDIIKAIISGERSSVKLANMADHRCKTPKEIISKSLKGNWNEDLLFALKQSFDLYTFIQNQIKECEQKMESLFEQYSNSILSQTPLLQIPSSQSPSSQSPSSQSPSSQSPASQSPASQSPASQSPASPSPASQSPASQSPASQSPVNKTILRSKKPVQKKSKVEFDVEKYGCQIFGVNLMRIPGLGSGSLLKLIGELGHDFTEKFENYKKFCKWENLAPNNKITGGKIISSKLPKRKNPVGQIVREMAVALSASETALGKYYRRVRARKGPMAAIVATANKISKIIYTMVKTQTEYDESMVSINQQEYLQKKLKSLQKRIDVIQKQIKDCEISSMSQLA